MSASTTVEETPTVGWADFVAAGLTYRQFDYWTSRGYLRAVPESVHGSGVARRLAVGELDVARRMLALLAAGLTLAAAAVFARDPDMSDDLADLLVPDQPLRSRPARRDVFLHHRGVIP